MKYAILDIDGCCIDSFERVRYLLKGDYESYLANYDLDTSLPQGVYFYKQILKDPKLVPVFVTARSEQEREITLRQLSALFPQHDFNLLMRPLNNNAEASELKYWLCMQHNIIPENIFIAFDDKPETVAMWRSHRVVCYQTGDYNEAG